MNPNELNLSFKELPSIEWGKESKKEGEMTVMTGTFQAAGKNYVITVKYPSNLDGTDKKIQETLKDNFTNINTENLASLSGKSIRFNADTEKKWSVFSHSETEEKEEVNFHDEHQVVANISKVFSQSFGVFVTPKEEEEEKETDKPEKQDPTSKTEIKLKKVKTPDQLVLEKLTTTQQKFFNEAVSLIANESWLSRNQQKNPEQAKEKALKFCQVVQDNLDKIQNKNEFFGDHLIHLLKRGVEIDNLFLSNALCHVAKKHENVQVIELEASQSDSVPISRLEVENPQKVLIPFRITAGHFVLYAYDTKSNKLYRYDSAPKLSGNNMDAHDQQVEKVLENMFPSVEISKTEHRPVPKQVASDCGMHVYKNAQFFLENKKTPKAEEFNMDNEPATDYNRERFNMLLATLGQDPN